MSDTIEFSSEVSGPKRRGRIADFFIRLLKEKPLGTFGGMVTLLFIVLAIFAEGLAPYPYREIHLADILQAPSVQYLLGTDHLGRDLLSRLLYGARISLSVGLAATALNVLIAVLIGGTSGYLGGKVDLAVQRFVDAWMAFPGLLLLLTIMSIVGQASFRSSWSWGSPEVSAAPESSGARWWVSKRMTIFWQPGQWALPHAIS